MITMMQLISQNELPAAPAVVDRRHLAVAAVAVAVAVHEIVPLYFVSVFFVLRLLSLLLLLLLLLPAAAVVVVVVV